MIPVYLPPLRHRPEDIAPLAVFFMERLSRDLKRGPTTLLQDTIAILEAYSWPGNVRELRNVLERALILEDAEEIRPHHLPGEIRGTGTARATGNHAIQLPADGVRVEEVERDLIRQALARTGGNVTQAAKLLGLSRDTLRYRLEKHGISGQGAVAGEP